jgi:hypothetical protein
MGSRVILVVAAVIAVAAVAAVVNAEAKSASPGSHVTVLKLLAPPGGTTTTINVGKRGPSPGDEFVTTDSPLQLPKSHARVGRLDIIEIAMGATRSSLTVSARLPGGKVQLQGVFNPNNRRFTLPIIGGTGAYVGAHGEATLSSGGSVPTLTFDLLA